MSCVLLKDTLNISGLSDFLEVNVLCKNISTISYCARNASTYTKNTKETLKMSLGSIILPKTNDTYSDP